MKKIIFSLLLSFAFLSISAQYICLDLNQPVDNYGNVSTSATSGPVLEAGAKWVRLNFVLFPDGAGGNDVNNWQWKQKYWQIINDLKNNANVQIYAVISSNVMSVQNPLIPNGSNQSILMNYDEQSQFGDNNLPNYWHGDNQWIVQYREKVISIMNEFGSAVKHFEILNEPDNWYNGYSQGKIHPRYVARILKEVYYWTHTGNGGVNNHSSIKVISGPLLTTDHGDGVTNYLASVLSHGKYRERWYGSTQLDGYGYHIYVKQSGNNLIYKDVRDAIVHKCNIFRNTVNNYFWGDVDNKKLYVSEVGWQHSQFNSNMLNLARAQYWGMHTLRYNSQLSYVQLASLFCTKDFTSVEEGVTTFGIRYGNMVTKKHNGYAYPLQWFKAISGSSSRWEPLPRGLAEELEAMELADRLNPVELAEEAESFEVRPNPASTDLFVDLKGDLGQVTIQLLDITGQELHREAVDGSQRSQLHFDLQSRKLNPGIYLVRMSSDTRQETRKVVIQ